jgi:hypothetical protein
MWGSEYTLRILLQQWLEVSALPPKSVSFIQILSSQGFLTIHHHCKLVIVVISSVSPPCMAMVTIWHHPCLQAPVFRHLVLFPAGAAPFWVWGLASRNGTPGVSLKGLWPGPALDPDPMLSASQSAKMWKRCFLTLQLLQMTHGRPSVTPCPLWCAVGSEHEIKILSFLSCFFLATRKVTEATTPYLFKSSSRLDPFHAWQFGECCFT